MPGGSYSLAGGLQERRRHELVGTMPQINWSSKPRLTILGRSVRDSPATAHALAEASRTTARDATRSRSNLGNASKRQSMHFADPLSLSNDDDDKRLSDISVITQVRVGTSRSSTIVADTGRSTPRPHTSEGEPKSFDTRDSAMSRARAVTLSAKRTASKEEPSGARAAEADYHAALRRMGGQDPVVKRRNKLAKMFGDDAPPMDDSPTGSRKQSLDILADDIDDDLLADLSTDTDAPALPKRSSIRVTARQSRPPRVQHRPSGSIDRSTHNSSVASSANPESDLTNMDSDVFTEEGDDSSSLTSAVSEASDEDDEGRKLEVRAATAMLPLGAYASEGEHPSALRVNARAAANAPITRANQQLPSPPDAVHCYDMLAMRSPTGVERPDFGTSRDPSLAKAGEVPVSPLDSHLLDLARRPSSPALSDVSDAESYDSACPPPVSLHRDHNGPKWKSHHEQKRAYKKQSDVSKKEKNPTPQLTPTTSRFPKLTPKKSMGDTGVDLTVRPAHVTPRNASVVSMVEPNGTQPKSYFNAPVKSSQGFSWSTLFSRKKKAQQDPEPILPPLRKITFDTRGQKTITDLASPSREVFSRHSNYSEADVQLSPRGLRPRAYTQESKRSASSHGQYLQPNSNQGTWRQRVPGAPRRTAWK